MQYTIAVSGINAIDNPGPGTGISRSLKESDLDVRIIGLAYDAMEPGIYMDWLIDRTYILPYPSAGVESYMSRLSYIHQKENIDIIIPALDAELPLYMKTEDIFENMGIKMMIPERESFRKRSKDNLKEIAANTGLVLPDSKTISSEKDLEEAAKEYGYPLMVKGPFYEAFCAENRSEVLHHFHALAAKWGFPIILQKYVRGDEVNLVGLGDGKGGDMGHLAIKKMLITKLGKVWTNVSIINNRIEDAAQKLVSYLKWKGAFELELIFDNKNDIYYLIEVNPRFPAWLYMASGCGINLPERMVKKLLDMPYDTHSNYKAGKLLIRYTGELIKDISDFEKMTTIGEN
ncbi:MAG: ATP-grasp domain-containing protein [Chitinispirillia bacterium]|jgi:carbamoyl-phosphate synthase large subunit